MIADIIKQVYSSESDTNLRELLEQPIVCGSLFRSFDPFTQHLIFLMYANQGILSRSELIASMQNSPHKAEGTDKLAAAIANLTTIKIVTRSSVDSDKIVLNEAFESRLNSFIVNPVKTFGEHCTPPNDDFFNLLQLVKESNDLLRSCKIGGMTRDSTLTRQNFDFIRLPIGYKISILLKGYLKSRKNPRERRVALKNILRLSEMDAKRLYKIVPDNALLIDELERIRLVRRLETDSFLISPHLHNFAFEQKTGNKLLQCQIVVETNFKVYVQIPKGAGRRNYELIRDIIRSLIKLEHEDYTLQELLVGEIKQEIMTGLFLQGIGVQEYLSFFLEYMAGDLKIEKDLGKWNKIKFLGLEGPEGEMMVPNNVRQELKLWESISRSNNPIITYGDDRNQDYSYSPQRDD